MLELVKIMQPPFDDKSAEDQWPACSHVCHRCDPVHFVSRIGKQRAPLEPCMYVQ